MKYLPHIAAGFVIIGWVGVMVSFLAEAAQAWYMAGEMAAIDALQWMAVLFVPITAAFGLAAAGAYVFVDSEMKHKG